MLLTLAVTTAIAMMLINNHQATTTHHLPLLLPIVDAFSVIGTNTILQQHHSRLHTTLKPRNPSFLSLSTSTTPITSIATNSVMINIDVEDDKKKGRRNHENDNVNDLFYGCTTQQYDNYDVVTVDLDNDRDYPIYIGTDFTNEQGMTEFSATF